MKCTACGEELVNGRCPFCGYRPTEADLAADAAWRRQKASLSRGEGGADWKAERPSLSGVFRGAAPKKAKAPKAEPGGKAPAKPARTPAPAPRQRSERQAKPAPGKRDAGAGRKLGVPLLVRLAVAAWILFAVWSFLQVLAGETGIDPLGIFGSYLFYYFY